MSDKKSSGVDLDRVCRNLFLEDCALWEEVVDWNSINQTDLGWFRMLKENYSLMLTAPNISEEVKNDYVRPILENIEKVLNG